jgi:hypothetical protein
MIIARQKRKENIAEYILYMWHIEDTIRAYKFDIEAIYTHIISKFSIDDTTKKEMREWYESLIEMMNKEQVMTKGHLQINNSSVRLLSDLHIELLENEDENHYHSLYHQTLPIIEEFKHKNSLTEIPSIEVCLQFMYGIWLLKIQKKEISAETNQAVLQIGKLLAFLSKKFKNNEEN